MNPETDTITCLNCGYDHAKDDSYRTDDGSWLCDTCREDMREGYQEEVVYDHSR